MGTGVSATKVDFQGNRGISRWEPWYQSICKVDLKTGGQSHVAIYLPVDLLAGHLVRVPVDGAHLERNSVPRDRAVHGYVRWSTSSCGESLGEEVAVGLPVEICDDLDFF